MLGRDVDILSVAYGGTKRTWTTLLTKKTTWAGVAGIATALGGYLAGEITLTSAAQSGLECLALIFLRMGVSK